MLKLTFYTVGTMPRGPYTALANDFSTRLGRFVDFDVREIKDLETLPESAFTDAFLIVLEATGKTFTSEAFASQLQKLVDEGQRITVILGGPFGVPNHLKQRANLLLSLSPMTMPHDLARLVFLEQLFRAFTIITGKTYHY